MVTDVCEGGAGGAAPLVLGPQCVCDAQRYLRLRMRKRKDLCVLHRKHDWVVLASAGEGAHFDVVEEMVEWLRERCALGISEDAPLFCHKNEDAPLFCHKDGSAIRVSELRT